MAGVDTRACDHIPRSQLSMASCARLCSAARPHNGRSQRAGESKDARLGLEANDQQTIIHVNLAPTLTVLACVVRP